MRVEVTKGAQVSLEEIAQELRLGDNFIITFHINPDYDAVGAALSMFYILKKMEKNVIIVGDEEESIIRKNFGFLPLSEEIKHVSVLDRLPVEEYALIALDSGDERRLGKKVNEYFGRFKKIINIDHHYDNTRFGTLNYVNSDISGVSEIIYTLVEILGIELTKEIASLIYAGIVDDSGSFRFDSTKPSTHVVASRLLETGIKPSFFTKNMYQNRSLEFIKFEGELFSKIRSTEDKKIVWVIITADLLAKYNLSESDTEPVVEDIDGIKDCVIYFVIKEKKSKGVITVALRSKDDIDVSQVAQKFGGGGHKNASGVSFDISVGIENVEKVILDELKKII